MLLRSISKYVKDQNWFAVELDFFIAVFGIFIDLQVSNWNDTRLREQTAQAYIWPDLFLDLGFADAFLLRSQTPCSDRSTISQSQTKLDQR